MNPNTLMTPLGEEEIRMLGQYAEHILSAVREGMPDFGYDARAVELLSRDIDRKRLSMNEEQKVKIANLYGAFLGQAILQTPLGAQGRWVRMGGDIGIVFEHKGKQQVVFPINRVFSHIEQGEEASMVSLYLALRDVVEQL